MEEDECAECECGGAMIKTSRADDEEFLLCQVCGDTQQIDREEDGHFDYAGGAFDGGTTYVHEDGKGAKTAGVKYQIPSISEGRKAGKAIIHTLCQKFHAQRYEDEMQFIFKLLKSWRNLTAVAAAVFISIYRRERPISIKQVLPVLNSTPPVTMFLLGISVKRVDKYRKEKLPAPTATSQDGQPSTSATPEIGKDARFILSSLKVQDPFMPNVEITERVYNITNKIVGIYERRIKKSFDRRIVTIAAGFLAWQSCHYYDKNHNGQVPFTELREPKEKSDFKKYLTLTQLDIDDHNARSITRNVSFISKELLQLFKHMTWIVKRGKCRKDVPKYLELILQFEGMTTDVLNKEEETERLNEPIITPIIPRELTAEEEAILDAPELSEKDLPDAELSKYIRSHVDVTPVEVHLSYTTEINFQLAEMEEKRREKQQKNKNKKKSKSKSDL